MAPPGRMLTEAGGGVMGEVQRERQAAGRVSPGWGRRPQRGGQSLTFCIYTGKQRDHLLLLPRAQMWELGTQSEVTG